MSRLIVDIETVGKELRELDDVTRAYFLRGKQTAEEVKEVEETLGFYPVTAEVVAIGLLNPDTSRGAVYFQTPGEDPLLPFEEGGITYATGSEREILARFWETVRTYESLVTFNGRGFDCPFLLVRSAVHGIAPTRDLMPNRYSDLHIDLMDRLSFFGSVRRKFSLDIWCRALGLESPKQEMSGYEVAGLYREGRHLDIARYCARDLFATKGLFEVWEKYIGSRPV
ncbi:MAG: ribonuclease H-like domain-containing protein [Nitrospirota bacterium]|jgi:DNA polymerase elongation subunit (family B)